MIESHLTYSDLFTDEPIIESLPFTSDPVLEKLLPNSLNDLVIMLNNKLGMGNMRKTCKHLDFTLSTKTTEDIIGRRRLVIKLTSPSLNTFTLSGTDDDSNETWDVILTDSEITTDLIEESFLLPTVYKYYKLEQNAGAEFSKAYLVETSFELLHKYLALSMAFKRLEFLQGDVYEAKAKYYMDMFNDMLNNLQYSFDSNDDGKIDSQDTLMKVGNIEVMR